MCIVALIQTRNNSGLKHLEHGLLSEEAQDKSDSLKKTLFTLFIVPVLFFFFFF